MKFPILSTLLVCGCLATFSARAVSFEYDWSFSSDPSTTGQISFNASSGSGSPASISSYSITANGITFTSANSFISPGSFLMTQVWDSSTIDTLSLQIILDANISDILSVTDTSISGVGLTKKVDGEWDAPVTSAPDSTNTLVIFAVALGALGWYAYGVSKQRMAVAPVKKQDQKR